jgi:hypothetical protein
VGMAEVTITVVHTADLSADAARQARRVLDLAFEDDDPMSNMADAERRIAEVPL